MHHSSFSTSKRKARFALTVAALLAGITAVLVSRGDLAIPRLAYVALGAVFLALVVLVARRSGRPRDETRIEPTFETSILAFPPEPKFERRPLRSQ